MSQWSVGQAVVVRERNYGRGPARETETTVSRVGRKYVYAMLGHREVRFCIEDGVEQSYSNYSARLFTPEGIVADRERAAAHLRLAELTRNYGWIEKLTTEQITRITRVIEDAD